MTDQDLGEYLRRIAADQGQPTRLPGGGGPDRRAARPSRRARGGAARRRVRPDRRPPASEAPSAAASAASAAPISSAPVGDREGALHVQLERLHRPENIEAFKAEFGVDKFQYDTYANNEELIDEAPGRRDRPVRHRRADRRVRPGDGRAGLPPEARHVADPERPSTSTRRSRACGGIRPTSTRSRRTAARPGSRPDEDRHRGGPRPGRSSSTSPRKYSGKIVFVDSLGDVFVVPAQDARLLAQLGRPGGARAGAPAPHGPRAARPGARLGHVRGEDRRRGGRPGLVWTGAS